jgi:hypothetical protein
VVGARDVGLLRNGQDAGRVNHMAGNELVAAVSPQAPDMLVLIEGGSVDPRVKADAVVKAVLARAVVGIRTQLVSGCVYPRPVGALLERVLVAERRDVDADAGVAVPVPGPTERVAGLDDQVVVNPGLVEADSDADPGEAGTDDQDFVVGHACSDVPIVQSLLVAGTEVFRICRFG